MIWWFKLNGTVPSKKNSKRIVSLNGGRKALLSSKAYLDWEQGAKIELIAHKRPSKAIAKCDMVVVRFGLSDKRRRDLTNMVEGVMDLLVSLKIILDDNWQVVPEIRIDATGSDDNFVTIEIYTKDDDAENK